MLLTTNDGLLVIIVVGGDHVSRGRSLDDARHQYGLARHQLLGAQHTAEHRALDLLELVILGLDDLVHTYTGRTSCHHHTTHIHG